MGNNPISMVDPDGGWCTDVNGNQIPCGELSDIYGNDDIHTTLLPDFEPTSNYHSSLFIQYEIRGALVLTGSQAFGLMFDTQGNIGVYETTSFGAGVVLGAYNSWSGGFSTADEIYDLEGWGYNLGGVVTANLGFGANLSGEINLAAPPAKISEIGWDHYKSSQDIGLTIGIPIQAGTFGAGFGAYGDISYTKILFSTRGIERAVDYFVNQVHSEGGESLDQTEILNTISSVKK